MTAYILFPSLLLIALALWSARGRWRQGRRLAAGRRAALGVLGLPLVVGGALLGSNLYTYQALTRETDVAELHFTALGERHYRARLSTTGAAAREFELRGDEWQLDARMIKWHGLGSLLGLDPLYRLDRLSGRYRNTAMAHAAAPSLHGLADDRGIDLWQLARNHPLGLIDAVYGSSVYLPMENGANYQVTLSHSGLIARRTDPEDGLRTRFWQRLLGI